MTDDAPATGPRGFGPYARATAGFWRSAIDDYVISTAAIRPEDVVLDVGAGLGPATFPAAKRVARVIALEPSGTARAGLHLRRLGQRHRSRVSVVSGVVEDLPLDDASVDVVWSLNTMHHWEQVAPAVAEIARVTRPGARIVLVDEDFENPAHLMSRFGKSHHERYPMIDPTELGSLLSESGFEITFAGRTVIDGTPIIEVRATAD